MSLETFAAATEAGIDEMKGAAFDILVEDAARLEETTGTEREILVDEMTFVARSVSYATSRNEVLASRIQTV
jgi:hypothetical protein